MKAAQVITAVEDFIRQSLVHAYPLFGKEEYPLLNDKIVRQDGRIKVDGHIFQIPSCKSPEIDRLQIPQTRFVFYTISTENGKVTILRLLSTILVSLDTIGKKETVSVELAQGWRVALLEDVRHLITKKNMVFETSSKGVFILSTDSIAINTDKIPQLLTRLKAKEQSIHPLIHSNVNNKMIMQEIDRIWTQLYPFIGQDKDIGKAELGAEPEIILWLQEIYIYFGWYKELRKFYANKETFEGNNIAKMANSRYRIVVSDLNPDKPIDKPVIRKNTFLYFYLYGWQDAEETLLENIQNKWESISSPARQEYFKGAVRNNPHEFIAFSLLARQLNLCWAQQVAERIESCLEGTMKYLFRLMTLLQTSIAYSIDINRIRLQANPETANRQLLSHTEFEFRSNRFGKETFTGFHTKDGYDIQIDKAVLMDIFPKKKRIRIKPLLYHPPNEEINYNFLSIYDGKQTIQVPLIWHQFRLLNKNWRIKFLLKKHRFQLSVRLFNKETRLTIGNIPVETFGRLYHKMYWPAGRNLSKTVVNLCDERGNRKYSTCKTLKYIYLHGFGLNNNGLLQEQFNIFLNDLNKSRTIRVNNSLVKGIPMVNDLNKIKLTARKCEPFEKIINTVSGYPERFLSTVPELLKELMIIYIEQNNEREVERIKYKIKENLGFWPCIRSIDEIRWDRNSFVFILSTKFSPVYRLIDDFGFFQIVQPANLKNVYAFFIKKSKEDYLFTDMFFQKMVRFENQNKFDFKM